MGRLILVGMGPGDACLRTGCAEEAIWNAVRVVVSARYLPMLPPHADVRVYDTVQDAVPLVHEALPRGDVAVCVSGDPGLFSLRGLMRKAFPETRIEVVSGIGSLQYLCDRLGEGRESAALLSAHGRGVGDGRLIGTVATHAMTLLLLDNRQDPAWLCRTLCAYGLGDLRVAVGMSLGMPGESMLEGTAQELAGRNMAGLCAARIRNDAPLPAVVGFGLPDEAFVRGDTPMTKAEVRAVALAKLGLHEEAVVWDIGAGTGSVSVECARLCRYGLVHALERADDAVGLLRANRERFRLPNLRLHQGQAPAALVMLPDPTHVFVGGSGGELAAVLEHVACRGARIRVVVAAVTLETQAAAGAVMGKAPFADLEVVQLGVARSRRAGRSTLMMAQNPVTLFSAWTDGSAATADSDDCRQDHERKETHA